MCTLADGPSRVKGRRSRPRRPWLTTLRWSLAAGLAGAAAVELSHRRHELTGALRLFAHLRWWPVGMAGVTEVASLMAFAQMQRRLLSAGGVEVGLPAMTALVTAGNALGTSLPGGAAWSAGWEWNQLRRRGASRSTVVWVLLTAGALSSFTLFVVIATGIALAGSQGPLAATRWAVAALTGIPVTVGLVALAVHGSRLVHRMWSALASAVRRRVPASRHLVTAWAAIRRVEPRPAEWLSIGGLALGNWLANCGCLVAAIWALGSTVPWRGVLVSYGFAQVAAALPITPGGLGVVEGSLAALLVAYGMATDEALATVGLYRLISFWAPALVGWSIWGVTLIGQRADDSGPGPPSPAEATGTDTGTDADTGKALRP